MSNQSQRDAIRSIMHEHGVNYTTARRMAQNREKYVQKVADHLRDAASELLGRDGFKPFDFGSLSANGFYDPLRVVESPTFVNLGCEGDPSEYVLNALRDLGATAVTPDPDGGTIAPLGVTIQFSDVPQDDARGWREQVQDRLDVMVSAHDWRYHWEDETLWAAAAPPLPSLAPFPAEGSAKCEAWHEQFRRGVIGLGPAKGGGIASIDLNRSPHVLLGGYAGSGKTLLANLLAYGVVSSPAHVEAVLVDVKGMEYGWVPEAGNLTLLTGPDVLVQARDALRGACDEMVRRQALLREHNAENLAHLRKRGEVAVPRRLLLILDDAGVLFAPHKDPGLRAVQNEARAFAEQISMLGRAMEVHLVALAQRPSHENLGSALRAQLTSRIGFGPMGKTGLVLLGFSSSMPPDSPKGRARLVDDDGRDAEVQAYAMPVRDLVDPETRAVLGEGVVSRLKRRRK